MSFGSKIVSENFFFSRLQEEKAIIEKRRAAIYGENTTALTKSLQKETKETHERKDPQTPSSSHPSAHASKKLKTESENNIDKKKKSNLKIEIPKKNQELESEMKV